MQSRVVMLVDLDYFYAQCEEKRNPAIKDKPVVVCMFSGRSEDSGAVATANYVARKYGVRSGIPIFMAKKKLEGVDSVFLPADFALYEQVSANVMSILKEYADSFEQVGIDEAFLDVSQRVNGDFESARELAQRIRIDMKSREGLSVSIGVGPNKLVAKIAADVQKPDGLTVVKPEEVEGFLDPLPVDRLIGVGRKTVERLQLLNVRTVGDLRRFDVQRLVEVFGRSLGVYFHDAAAGIDDSPVEQRGEAESFSRIATLKEDTRDINVILEKTNVLCEEVHGTLTMQGYSYRTVGIYVVLANMTSHSRSKTFESPTDDLSTFRETVKELFDKLLAEMDFKVRRVGVKVAGLVRVEKGQKALTDFMG